MVLDMASAVQDLKPSTAGREAVIALGTATATIGNRDVTVVDPHGNRNIPTAGVSIIHMMDHRAAGAQSSETDRANPALAQMELFGHVRIPADLALESREGVGFFLGQISMTSIFRHIVRDCHYPQNFQK